MSERKPPPLSRNDGRRVYPIDELRAKAWYSFVARLTGCQTPSALAKQFGGERKKWVNYKSGGQPNEMVLTAVDEEVPGSREIYLAGPGGLKLWPALGSTDAAELQLIGEMSELVDGEIAQFKVAAIAGELDGDLIDGSEEAIHPIDVELFYIHTLLVDAVGNELAKMATTLLEDFVRPYKSDADRTVYDEHIAWCLDLRIGPKDVDALVRQENFRSLRLGTVLQKGRRKRDE